MKDISSYPVGEPLHIDAWGGLKISGVFLGVKKEKIGRFKKLEFLLLGGTYFDGVVCPFAEMRLDYVKTIRPFRKIYFDKTTLDPLAARGLLGMTIGEAIRNETESGTPLEILNSLKPDLKAQGLEDVDYYISEFCESYPKRSYNDLSNLSFSRGVDIPGAEEALRFYRLFLLKERFVATWYLIGRNAILLDSSIPPLSMIVQGNTKLRTYSITARIFQATTIPGLEYSTAFFVRPSMAEEEINEVVLGFQTFLKRFLGFQDDTLPHFHKLVSKQSRLGILVNKIPPRKSSLINKAKHLDIPLQIIPIPLTDEKSV